MASSVIVTDSIQLTYDSNNITELMCAYCNGPFGPDDKRRHEIVINTHTNAIIKFVIIHANNCLQERDTADIKEVYSRIILPKNQQHLDVSAYKDLVDLLVLHTLDSKHIYALAVKLSFPLDCFALTMPLYPLVACRRFTFNQFKALFTCVDIRTIQLTRKKDGPPINLSTCFQVIKTKLKTYISKSSNDNGCAVWLWVHQVSGSNDAFTIIRVVQPLMINLIKPYEDLVNSNNMVWQQTVYPDNNEFKEWQITHNKLDNQVTQCIKNTQIEIESCIKLVCKFDFESPTPQIVSMSVGARTN